MKLLTCSKNGAIIKIAESEVRNVEIVEVKKPLSGYGKVLYYPLFNEEEKECASKIIELLKGMTIYEAQQLLSKVSEALIFSSKI